MDELHNAMVTIWCMNARHGERGSVVAVLARRGNGEWWPRADNLGERMAVLEDDMPADPHIAGNYKSYPFLRGGMSGDVRRHFESDPCPECGDKLSCRGERLDPVLDEFYRRALGAGVVKGEPGGRVLPVPLATLAAKVGSR